METAVRSTLTLTGIGKEYPGTTALSGVDLTVRPGEVTALLGENGAGKSTLSSIIAGVIQPTVGNMEWQGQTYAPSAPGDAIEAGISLIHQELRLLPDLSVEENILVGRWPTKRGLIDYPAMRSLAEAQLSRLGFKGRMDQSVGSLSVAGQQQVEIAKALMIDASVLILDEPTAALGQAETDALFECIRSLKAQGHSFIYVSHRLSEIAQIADRIVVLRDGRKIAEHDSGSISEEQLVREMVGRPVERLFPEIPKSTGSELLVVDGLSDKLGRFTDVSFSVRAGEVLGIAGIVGAGRTELVRSVAGLEPRASGRVTVAGTEIKPNRPADALKGGIVLIPEDRKQQGVDISETIENNIALPNLARVRKAGFITPRRVRKLAEEVAAKFTMKGNVASPVGSLSGGNQQKVVIGKWLETDPDVILLDEPTRGIDVGARASIYEIIDTLARAGKAVVVVSSDLDEVLGLAHRVLVLAKGRNQGILPADEATPQRVMSLAVQ
ncbi:sugar ABC transporter ATP-binding protein [Pseudarthrobacter oxydans]|uniref:sugar ABC transporter ATP-binding protein n=1 Tax=Pseudarthrobacter oxydans TaxID=1671 RepID=UPI003D2751DF